VRQKWIWETESREEERRSYGCAHAIPREGHVVIKLDNGYNIGLICCQVGDQTVEKRREPAYA